MEPIRLVWDTVSTLDHKWDINLNENTLSGPDGYLIIYYQRGLAFMDKNKLP